ncbi:MAG: OmpA family protein [Candidatus Kapabacteria bacterium]|nr:OmpA family protein [Candidatus Kapabacteria bacterium]MCS7169083.1 OmpA family protein [Candidatus Kapabacteria bacterium]MDW7996820.1 OmpA family protein [Bacteroidota bacterium]MDW8224439.1 OmpA family protein [Bacteroidota bacterium]
MMRWCILLGASLLCWAQPWQIDRPSLLAEGFFGGTKYIGEFTDISFWYSGGGNLWYRVDDRFWLGSSVSIGQIRFRVVNEARYWYSFREVLTRVTPVELVLRWNLMPWEPGVPYITAGAGWMSFEVHQEDGTIVPLRFADPGERRAWRHPQNRRGIKSCFHWHLGAGYEWQLDRRFSVGAFARYFFTTSDVLDGIAYVNSRNDNFLIFGLTASFGFTSPPPPPALTVVRVDTVFLSTRDTVLYGRRDTIYVPVSLTEHYTPVPVTEFLPEPIYFAYGSAEITPEGERVVQQVAEFLRTHPESVVEIGGYADIAGSFEFNQRLALRRAQAVAERLQLLGIEPWRLILRPYGKVLATQVSQHERRVEFKLLQLRSVQ